MTEPQTQTPYRKSEPQDEPEPTKTVSDWEAFRVGVGRVMLFPAAIFGGLLFFFWLAFVAAALDVARYVGFRAVEIGHQELGVKSSRKFHSYLYGGIEGFFEGVDEKARLVPLVRFFSISSWLLSTAVWSATVGFLIAGLVDASAAGGVFLGFFFGTLAFCFGGIPLVPE